jgi:hypothetical protein
MRSIDPPKRTFSVENIGRDPKGGSMSELKEKAWEAERRIDEIDAEIARAKALIKKLRLNKACAIKAAIAAFEAWNKEKV